MPRTLPWLQQKIKSPEGRQAAERAPKRQRTSTPNSGNDDLATIGFSTPERQARARPARTPSTSPPPAPPDQEFMREGYAADDIYIMVEDEFLATAQQFTKHLHHAEYVRLKQLAKARGNAAANAMARPVDGKTAQSAETKLRLEADARSQKIKADVRRISRQHSSDEDEDEPWMCDPQLAGLMGSEKRSGEVLASLAKAGSLTRVPAGFSKDARVSAIKPENIFKGFADRSHCEMKLESRSSNAVRFKDSGNVDDYEARKERKDDGVLDSKVSTKLIRAVLFSEPSNKGLEARRPTGKMLTDGQLRPSKFSDFTVRDRIPSPRNSLTKRDDGRNEVGCFSRSTAMASSAVINASDHRAQQSKAVADLVAKRKALREKKEDEEKQKAKRVIEVPTWLV